MWILGLKLRVNGQKKDLVISLHNNYLQVIKPHYSNVCSCSLNNTLKMTLSHEKILCLLSITMNQ